MKQNADITLQCESTIL